MSTELKQLFHSPEDFSDQELDIMRLKLQNMRRIPKIGAVFGATGAAFAQGVLLRKQPGVAVLLMGAAAGYAFGGYGASAISSNMLARDIDYDIIFAQEKRQLRKTMNLAGYGRDHISAGDTMLDKSHDHPY